MKDLLANILGEYTFKYDDAGNLIGGLAGLDYDYLFGGVVFVLCLVFLGCLGRSLFIRLFD